MFFVIYWLRNGIFINFFFQNLQSTLFWGLVRISPERALVHVLFIHVRYFKFHADLLSS